MTPRFTRAMFVYLASGIGQQRDGAAHVALVDQARSARTQLALGLARLVAEVVAAAGGIRFVSLRRLAEALRRRPVRLQFGHDSTPVFLASFRKMRGDMPCTRWGRTGLVPRLIAGERGRSLL